MGRFLRRLHSARGSQLFQRIRWKESGNAYGMHDLIEGFECQQRLHVFHLALGTMMMKSDSLWHSQNSIYHIGRNSLAFSESYEETLQ